MRKVVTVLLSKRQATVDLTLAVIALVFKIYMDVQNTICPAFQLLNLCYEGLAMEKNKNAEKNVHEHIRQHKNIIIYTASITVPYFQSFATIILTMKFNSSQQEQGSLCYKYFIVKWEQKIC
jgi:hypothetical protein